ncbi:MAG: hypothetical protein JEY94_07890 [Melioribacteraceae bacterium]|nr:hypothetical protein [Melioribacteraceae bacterium]
MKRILIVLILVAAWSNIYSQVNPSVSNYLRYGIGDQEIGELTKDFEYTENVLDFRLGLPQSITIGFRLQYDQPPEVGPKFKGIKRRFIEYRKDGFYLRGGDLSEVYGKGMVLNLFENRGIAFDTWLDGIKINYKYKNFDASLIAGTIDYRDSIDIARHEIYKLSGGNLNYEINTNLSVGGSFIRAEADIPQFIDESNLISETPEIYLSANTENFEFFVNYTHSWKKDRTLRETYSGYGIYSSGSYFSEGFGFTLEYKNYRFDITDPFRRFDNSRTSKIFPFQNPPIVMKEHSSTLLSRPIHEIDFNDEVGLQAEFYYLFNDLTFTLNASVASRHDLFVYNSSGFNFEIEERSSNFLPSLDEEYSPYYEIFLEGEYEYDFSTKFKLGAAYRNKQLYTEIVGSVATHEITSVVIPAVIKHKLSDIVSTELKYQLEFVNDSYNASQEDFNNQFLALLFSFKQKLSLAVRTEFTSNDYDVSGRTSWIVGEVGYRISSGNTVQISYGRERGGLVCTNGVCRYMLPFKGFRFSLQTII